MSASLFAAYPDTTRHCPTLNELKESGAFERINDLSIFFTLGSEYTVSIHEEALTKKRTIGFNWSVDSVSFSHYEEIQRAALAFSDLINIYFLGENELRNLDEILIVVNRKGDSTNYYSFNLLIDNKLKYRKNTIDQKMKLLKDLFICKIEHITYPDGNNPFKSVLRLTINLPDIIISIDKNLVPFKEPLKKVVKNFIIRGHHEQCSKFQLQFVGQRNVEKEYTFPVDEFKNESL